MSFDEINDYLEVMQQKEKDDLKQDLNMRFYQAIMISAEKPNKVYQEIWNNLFKDKKPQTNKDMEIMAKNLNAMFGGKVKKGGD